MGILLFTNMSFDDDTIKKSSKPVFYEKIFSSVKEDNGKDFNEKIMECESGKKSDLKKQNFLNYLLNEENGSIQKPYRNSHNNNKEQNYFEDNNNLKPMKTTANSNPLFFKSYDFDDNSKSKQEKLESIFGINEEKEVKKTFHFTLSNITEKPESFSDKSLNF